jgi:hypothetical protein
MNERTRWQRTGECGIAEAHDAQMPHRSHEGCDASAIVRGEAHVRRCAPCDPDAVTSLFVMDITVGTTSLNAGSTAMSLCASASSGESPLLPSLALAYLRTSSAA